MPRKTKVSKILSDKRKQLGIVKTSFSSGLLVNNIDKDFSTPPLSKEETAEKNNFIADLKKSLLVIVFIISLEIIIYFVSMSKLR